MNGPPRTRTSRRSRPTQWIGSLKDRWRDRGSSNTGAWIADVTSDIVPDYSPRADGKPDPGEVVWVWVPYEDDPSQGKDRPALVIGRDKGLLVLVALTSKAHSEGPDAHEYIPVGSGSWDQHRRPSYAKIEHLLRAKPRSVRRVGGFLERPVFDKVLAAVRREHQLPGSARTGQSPA